MAYIEDPDLPAHPPSLESIFVVQNAPKNLYQTSMRDIFSLVFDLYSSANISISGKPKRNRFLIRSDLLLNLSLGVGQLSVNISRASPS